MTTALARRGALFAALAAIAVVCLPPSGPAHPPRVDLCLVCGQNGAASGLLNVVLYLPLGAALWWRWRSLARVVALGALVSFSVEAMQLYIPGRHTALSDLIANILGAAIGGGLAVRPHAWILPRGAIASVAAALVSLFGAGMIVLSGLLFTPSAPPGDYYGQWTPRGPYSPSYDGHVLEARMGDATLPSTLIDSALAIRARILRREPVTVRWVLGTTPSTLTPVFRLVAGPYDESTEALQVGVDGTALVLTPRFRADDARLSRPEVQLEGALEGRSAGDTVALTLRALPARGFEITVDDGTPTVVGFTAGHSWSLLYATSLRSARTLRSMDHLWFLGLAAALGWSALGARARILSVALLLLAAGTTPLWSDLLPTPATEYAALAGGFAFGILARNAIAARQRRDGAQTS